MSQGEKFWMNEPRGNFFWMNEPKGKNCNQLASGHKVWIIAEMAERFYNYNKKA